MIKEGRDYVKSLRKYQYRVIAAGIGFKTDIKGKSFDCPYFCLQLNGWVVIKRGYCWDGPTGLPWHSRRLIHASLIHDVLWQMMREGLISKKYRKHSNELFRDAAIEDEVPKVLAHSLYFIVSTVGVLFH